MSESLMLSNARLLDLASGEVSLPTTLHVRDGLLVQEPTPGAERIDLVGSVVMPGLWDAHVHVNQWAESSRWIDVSTATCFEDAAAMLRGFHIEGEVLVGFGFRDSTWPSVPTSADLDATTGAQPCIVLSGDVHTAWLNTAAMQLAGLTGTGFLHEETAFYAQDKLLSSTDEVMDEWVDQAGARMAQQGLVGVVDLTMGHNLDAWHRRVQKGWRHTRVEVGTYALQLDEVLAAGYRTGEAIDPLGLTTMGPLKIISDGTLTARTAYCHLPYVKSGIGDPIQGHEHGQRVTDQFYLLMLMQQALDHGLECAVHAIGDRANTEVLDAFAQIGVKGSIEHAQLLQPTDVERMAQLGLRASVQPGHLLDDRDSIDLLWGPERAGRAFPWADMARNGVDIRLGSDAPIAPIDPWGAIETAVRRTHAAREPWHPEQSLTLSQALMASTHGVTELVPGGAADLVALPGNPFEYETDLLHTMSPLLTMTAGRLTWDGGLS